MIHFNTQLDENYLHKKKCYVLGFLFIKYKNIVNVVLIRKNKPKWQKGQWNGVGGKIEQDETPRFAMFREFKEETGFRGNIQDWKPFAFMDGKTWECYCFKQEFTPPDNYSGMVVESKTSEEVCQFVISPDCSFESQIVGKEKLIHNVEWLIKLALDEHPPEMVTVQYNT